MELRILNFNTEVNYENQTFISFIDSYVCNSAII